MNDIIIEFNDLTIIEADCSKSVVNKLMKEEGELEEWMLESEVILSNGLEESFGILQFWKNGEAILKEYSSGFYDEIVPVDLVFLKDYMSENGWDFLIDEDLVNGNPELWDKYFSVIGNNDDNEEDIFLNEEEYDLENDFYGDDDNFVDYINSAKEYRKPSANKYNMSDIKEFRDHKYDLEKREADEKERKF
ncbi:MAG: hypothetical protein ACOCUI_02730 [bacterium]